MIDKAKPLIKNYKEAKAGEAKARKKGDKVLADLYAELAALRGDKLDDLGDQIVAKVDQDYGINAPPGTTIDFDPDSSGYGYVPYTKDKSKIRVVICPRSLQDGPGLVASSKLHEIWHAWQVWWCFSSLPGFWEQCTFWDHWSEWDAYNMEERYYDACYTSDMGEDEKEVVKEGVKEHHEKMMKAARGILFTWMMPNIKERAGLSANAAFTVYNPTGAGQVVDVTVENELGWAVVPSNHYMIPLDPEQEVVEPISVEIPMHTEIGTVNRVDLVTSSMVGTVTDTLYIIVVPTVDVTPLGGLMGNRGESVPVEFRIENTGTDPDNFAVVFDNPLGWISTPVPPVPLAAGEVAYVTTTVQVPPVLPFWTTNAIVCSATSMSDTAQGDSAWSPLQVREYEVATMVIESPTSVVQASAEFIATTKVLNDGYIESFFDVYFEIRTSGDVVAASDVVSVSGLSPGSIQEITFSPMSIGTPGTYTMSVFTNLPEDADPTNDVYSTPLEVMALGIKEWEKY